MFKVQKKDGVQEDFDRNKIVHGVIKSGASLDEAEKVTAEIEKWLPLTAVDGVITTSDVRVKVLEILGTVNPTAASVFQNYKKPVSA